MLPTVISPTTDPQPRLAILYILLVLFTGCGRDKGANPDPQNMAAPADEATTEQKAMIGDTLTKIEATTAALEHPQTFRSIPVIVTSETRFLSDAKGACVKLGDRPQFILVSPAVLDFEKHLDPASKATTLFPVLLHEIGHCYFNRSHDSSKISLDGSEISLHANLSNAEEVVESLDASVMSPKTLIMERQLEHYYVAELMGLTQTRNLEALNAYGPKGLAARLIKREEEKKKERGSRPAPSATKP